MVVGRSLKVLIESTLPNAPIQLLNLNLPELHVLVHEYARILNVSVLQAVSECLSGELTYQRLLVQTN